MKGFSHFMTGVAAASCFPWSVQAATEGNPLYFILGGAFGLLPDTMDFKVYRFFYKHDLYIDPDPSERDPQAIADAIAGALEQAHRENREVRVKLNTIRMGVDYWQQYMVRFDPDEGEVQVRFGPVVNTGQVPVPGTHEEITRVGRARVSVPYRNTYEAVTTVDIFDGPSFSMAPAKDGAVEVAFLPWHRTWSHSLLTGVFFGILGGLLWGWQAGVIIPVAFAAHVLEDQLGHMGSNLFWPITKRRFAGLQHMHATDAVPNFLAVWLCCLLIFWNLYRVMDDPLIVFGLPSLLLFGAVLPLGAFALVHWFLTRKESREPGEIDSSDEWVEPLMS